MNQYKEISDTKETIVSEAELDAHDRSLSYRNVYRCKQHNL